MVDHCHTEGEAAPWEDELFELSLQLCQCFLEPPTVNDCATMHEFCLCHTFNIPDNYEHALPPCASVLKFSSVDDPL